MVLHQHILLKYTAWFKEVPEIGTGEEVCKRTSINIYLLFLNPVEQHKANVALKKGDSFIQGPTELHVSQQYQGPNFFRNQELLY